MKFNSSPLKNLLVSALLACSATSTTALAGITADEAFGPAAVGQPAPDFTLTDINGKSVNLKHFRKKYVVLEWINDGCPFVKKHYNSGNMQSLQEEFTKKGVVWIQVSSSASGMQGNHTSEEWKDILKKWNAHPTDLVLDPDGKVGHMYGAKTTPDMYVIGKDGTLLYAGAIDDKPDTDKESIKTAKNYVREALEEVMAGKSVATTTTKPYGCSVKYAG